MLFDRRHVSFLLLAGGLTASTAFGLGVFAEKGWDRDNQGSQAASRHVPTSNVNLAPLESPAPAISTDAATLLRAAATDNLGHIYVIDAASLYEGKGQRHSQAALRVRSSDRELCVEKTPRSRARWRAALAELTSAGLIEPAAADATRATYRLTLAGYEAADRLPSPATQQSQLTARR